MSSKDLKDLLGAVADEGRDTVDLDESHLVGRIRGRRRRQRVIVGAASVGTAAVIAAAAVAIVPNLGNQEPTVASDSGTSALGVAIGACGGAVTGEPRPDAPLELTAVGPLRPAPNPAVAFIDLQLTNTGSTPLDALSGEGAAITVAQNGVVVAQGLPARAIGIPVKLQPGESMKFQSGVSLRRCSAASAQTEQPLAAGSYQLYATRSFNPNDGGQAISVQGGPWTVELK